MKVYGHPWSINTRKVLTVFAEKGHEPELEVVMLPKGEHLTPEHRRLHPFAKVPVLVDEDFVLYETRAIYRYLEASFGDSVLAPSDAAASARCEQWLGIADSYFVPSAHPLLVERLFRRFLGGEPDDEVIARSREGMGAALDQADERLASSEHLAGPSFSVADLHWMPYLEYLLAVGEDVLVGRPALRRWWQAVSERPSWQRVARTGPQPYDEGIVAEAVETRSAAR